MGEYYRHGPLANTLLGNERVQRITNAYTIQGWMKGIVPEVQTDPFIAKQAFNYGLGYFDGDYTPIAGTNPFAAINQGANLYNGNIRAMLVNIPILGEPILHSYSYDQLNRIKAVNNFNGYVSTTNSWTATDAHKETLSFDPNGNIQKALLNGPATNLPNEDFTYNYDPVKQNRLLSISNAVNNTVSNYTYNEIGEVTRDELQNNTYFQWTVYGKLEKLVKANGTHLSYTYGPDGKRISKEVANSPTKDFTEFYVRDASGNIMATYQKDATVNGGHLSIKGFNMYGSNMIGTWDKTVDVETPSRPAVTAFIRGEQELFVGNHLGNNMLVLTDRKNQHSSDGINVDYYTPSIASATDYSAYGEDLIGREFNSGSISFGFNGKMNDAESGYQDYGMRVYDAKRRGFPTVDPLASEFVWNSTYAYAENDPINFIDLDGLEKATPKQMEFVKSLSEHWISEIKHDKTALALTNDKKIKKQLQIQLDIAKASYAKTVLFRYRGGMNEQETYLYYFNESAPYLKKTLDFTPAGDVKVLITGQNFQGEEHSRLAAAGWLTLDIFGGEILSGLGKAGRALRVIEGPGKEVFESIVKKVSRINNGLKDYHVTAAVGDIFGNPVVVNGKAYNHLKEVKDALNGLGNQISKLNELIHGGEASEGVVNAATEFRNQLQKTKDGITDVLNRATAKAAK